MKLTNSTGEMNIVEVESHDDMFHVVIVLMIEQFDLNIGLQRSKIISHPFFHV